MVIMFLQCLSGGLAGAAFAGVILGRISQTTANAVWAVANFLAGIAFVLNSEPFWACWCAGIAAWCAHGWWTGGGGDGTRRRLKSWARRFQGIRRTAPQGAS